MTSRSQVWVIPALESKPPPGSSWPAAGRWCAGCATRLRGEGGDGMMVCNGQPLRLAQKQPGHGEGAAHVSGHRGPGWGFRSGQDYRSKTNRSSWEGVSEPERAATGVDGQHGAQPLTSAHEGIDPQTDGSGAGSDDCGQHSGCGEPAACVCPQHQPVDQAHRGRSGFSSVRTPGRGFCACARGPCDFCHAQSGLPAGGKPECGGVIGAEGAGFCPFFRPRPRRLRSSSRRGRSAASGRGSPI